MATTEDNMTKIRDLELADRRLKVRMIAETVYISNIAWVISCMKIWARESCWCDWYIPETKEQSKQWTSLLGFASCEIHRLPGKGQNGHRALLCRIIAPMRCRIAEKRSHLAKKKVLFHHDKAPAHTSVVDTSNWSNCTKNCCPIHRIWHRS